MIIITISLAINGHTDFEMWTSASYITYATRRQELKERMFAHRKLKNRIDVSRSCAIRTGCDPAGLSTERMTIKLKNGRHLSSSKEGS